MTLIVSNELTNGAIDEEMIVLAHYSQNVCILLAKHFSVVLLKN